MRIKALIKKLLLIDRLQSARRTSARKRQYRETLDQLSSVGYERGRQIRQVLEQLQQPLVGVDQHWVKRIEEKRHALLLREEPLVDGSLGEGLHHDARTIKSACEASKGPEAVLMLYLLTRAIRPKQVIELGTNVGISSSFIGAALKANGQDAKLVTLEASAYRQALAKQMHRELGLDNIDHVKGFFADTLDSTLNAIGKIDLAFIDGHHKYQPTIDYFEQILSRASSDAVFVFDDIRWSEGMKRAWSVLQADERLGLIVDLHLIGICVPAKPNHDRTYLHLRLDQNVPFGAN